MKIIMHAAIIVWISIGSLGGAALAQDRETAPTAAEAAAARNLEAAKSSALNDLDKMKSGLNSFDARPEIKSVPQLTVPPTTSNRLQIDLQSQKARAIEQFDNERRLDVQRDIQDLIDTRRQ